MLEKILLRNKKNASWLKFCNPRYVYTSTDLSEVKRILQEIQTKVEKDGLYAAGYLSYEAAPAFDPAFIVHDKPILPLLCFGVYEEVEELSTIADDRPSCNDDLKWTLDTSKDCYEKKFLYIKQQIELGNTYQINYTLRNLADGITDPYSFFLAKATHAPFAAFIESQEHTIISASPELFFSLDGEHLESRPMKGTSSRGKTYFEDITLRKELNGSEKNLAENIMITDMLRNDMGRISEPGSVFADAVCELEKYPTVWQMTSTVKSRTKANFIEILSALFPCASVTGAPKIASMKIISEIENTSRDIYTGAIGYIAPGRRAQFSVPIRTILVDNNSHKATYGTGGGIVWDSDSSSEFHECLTKSKMLTSRDDDNFELFETILWEPEKGLHLIDYHFSRLQESASYFGFDVDILFIKKELMSYQKESAAASKVIKILVNKEGSLRILQSDLLPSHTAANYKISFAKKPIDEENIFYYHKTTKREIYELAKAEHPDSDDILFWNDKGEITETKIANVIFNIDDEWVTPPQSSGLLGGTYRAMLLEKALLKERIIHKSEILNASEITLINSVRGKFTAQLI